MLITIGCKGLKEELKDALSLQAEIPDTWPTFVKRINELDIRSYERHQEKNKTTRTRSDRDSNRSNVLTSRNLPQRNERHITPALPQNTGLNREPITPEERQRRITNNLCLRCGKTGHIARDCFAGGSPPAAAASSTRPTTYPASTTVRNVYPTTGQSSTPNSLNATQEERKGYARSSIKASAPSH